jgi:hypothetical protein
MAQYLRFPTPQPELFDSAFREMASDESKQKLTDWIVTLGICGLSNQSLKQILTAMQLAYYQGVKDSLKGQTDHMVTALMEARQ